MTITFVCMGNTCRSPMAEAIMVNKLDNQNITDININSVGLACNYGASMSKHTQKIINDIGMFFTHSSQPITPKVMQESDYLIAMERWQKNVLLQNSPQEYQNKIFCIDDFSNAGDIADPYGQSVDAYKKVQEQLDYAIDIIIDKVVKNNN